MTYLKFVCKNNKHHSKLVEYHINHALGVFYFIYIERYCYQCQQNTGMITYKNFNIKNIL